MIRLKSMSLVGVLGTLVLTGCITTTVREKKGDDSHVEAYLSNRPIAPTQSPPAADKSPVVQVSDREPNVNGPEIKLASGPRKPGEVARLQTAWSNKIVYAADSRNGQQNPGFAGSVYLFGPDVSVPLVGDGDLFFDLFDHTPSVVAANNGQPKIIETWGFSAADVEKFRTKDFVGDSYTIFLPSLEYAKKSVDMKKVAIIARYAGKDGISVLSKAEMIDIDHTATLQKAADKLGIKNPVQ